MTGYSLQDTGKYQALEERVYFDGQDSSVNWRSSLMFRVRAPKTHHETTAIDDLRPAINGTSAESNFKVDDQNLLD